MATCTQDMPPAGGYAPIVYKRVPLKTINPYWKLLSLLGISAVGWVGYYIGKREFVNNQIEMKCGSIALYPLLAAESDRNILKQLKKNYELEKELMKDVKGWEVGKWKDYPLFITLDENEYFRPSILELFAHKDPKCLQDREYII